TATVLGHIFSPWVRLKGGKGVATGLGAMLGLWPLVTGPAVLAFVVWVVTLKLTRYVSIASCAAAASLPLLAAAELAIVAMRDGTTVNWTVNWGGAAVLLGFLTALAAMVIFKHRSNIARIRAGAEPKIGARRGDDDARAPAPGSGSRSDVEAPADA